MYRERGAHQAVVVELLDDVGVPAGDPGEGEDRGIEFDVQAHVVVEPGARPVDVGGEILGRGDDALDRLGGLFPALVAGLGGQGPGNAS
jgi:hypothetical protein